MVSGSDLELEEEEEGQGGRGGRQGGQEMEARSQEAGARSQELGLGYNVRSEGVFEYREEGGTCREGGEAGCVHRERGCSWRGNVQGLGAHLATCRYLEITEL